MQPERGLLSLQRRFATALREPIYGDSRARSELPSRQGSVSAGFVETANTYITSSATLQPVERLELYHRQYWYRLLDSIAEDFPALRALLGEDPFWRLMEAYLEAVPSTSFTLRHLGKGLPQFVAANPGLVSHPVHVAELARLEYALCEAFEAGEAEPVGPAELGTGRIALQPHLRLLAQRSTADTLWRRAERGRSLGPLAAADDVPRRFVAVFRKDLSLYVERLPRAAFAILEAIDATASLEGAMTKVASQPNLLRRRDIERVSQWFGVWTSRGWIRRLDPVSKLQPDNLASEHQPDNL